MLGLDGKCKVHSLFVVFEVSIEIQLDIQNLLIVMGKPIRDVRLGTAKHDWTLIFWLWTNRKHALFARGDVWNSKVAFYNKTTYMLWQWFFNRDLLVVNPVQYFISMLAVVSGCYLGLLEVTPRSNFRNNVMKVSSFISWGVPPSLSINLKLVHYW